MTKPRVLTLVGTRPEIIRLSTLIPKLDTHTEHFFVHTGQNSAPQLNDVFFEDLSLRRPDQYLGVDTSSMGSVMAGTIIEVEKTIKELRPDALMVLGDTNSAIGALVAERFHIPVYHMEAGNRSFDANVPEEMNRRMVDHISTFNLPYNSYSYGNLIREGIHPRFMQITGSPIAEIWRQQSARVGASSILGDLGVKTGGYLLVSLHRQENVDDPTRLKSLLQAIRALSERDGLEVIFSTHPRTKIRISDLESETSGFRFLEAFGYLNYMKLQQHAALVISDSGTISEESAIVGFRAISARNSIERQEAIDSGHTVLSGTDQDAVLRSFDFLSSREFEPDKLPEGYEITNFSERVLSFFFSTYHQANNWLGRKPRVY
jgi:UDP-N-acetylglucosamine 2-epimerase